MPTTPDSRVARLKAFVAELREELPIPSPDDTLASTASTRQKLLSTIVSRCGSRLVRASVLKEIEAELAAARIHTHRPLSAPGLNRRDWIKLSLLPFPPDDLFFSSEQLLKEFLLAGIGRVGPLKALELVAKEFPLPSRRRVDLLCRERQRDGKGALVVVELKKAQDADGVVTQVTRYLDELSRHALANERKVRGIIVSGRADEFEAGQLSSEKRFRIDWYFYSVTLSHSAGTEGKVT